MGRAGQAYAISSDPMCLAPGTPDWVTRKVAEATKAADVRLHVKALRHSTASQLLTRGQA
jgi:hypothetical protein